MDGNDGEKRFGRTTADLIHSVLTNKLTLAALLLVIGVLIVLAWFDRVSIGWGRDGLTFCLSQACQRAPAARNEAAEKVPDVRPHQTRPQILETELVVPINTSLSEAKTRLPPDAFSEPGKISFNSDFLGVSMRLSEEVNAKGFTKNLMFSLNKQTRVITDVALANADPPVSYGSADEVESFCFGANYRKFEEKLRATFGGAEYRVRDDSMTDVPDRSKEVSEHWIIEKLCEGRQCDLKATGRQKSAFIRGILGEMRFVAALVENQAFSINELPDGEKTAFGLMKTARYRLLQCQWDGEFTPDPKLVQ